METENKTLIEIPTRTKNQTLTETKIHRVKITDKTNLRDNTQAISQTRTVVAVKVERTETEEEMSPL